MDIDTWLERLSAELAVQGVELDDDAVRSLLDLARDAAHGVERIAAPLTTFLVGVAVGQGRPLPAAVATATALTLRIDATVAADDDRSTPDPADTDGHADRV